MDAECPLHTRCGGCQMNDMSYRKELMLKQRYLEDQLGKFQIVAPILGMKNPSHYRNKVQAVFGVDRRGNVASGIYRRGTHILIPVRSCLLEDEKCDDILATIRTLVKSLGIMVYDEDAGTGFLRHVLLKRSRTTGQTMVVLVAGSFRFPQRKEFVGNLVSRHPEITSILLNKNDEQTSMVLSEEPEALLYGQEHIEDKLMGLTFRISAKSFYQVNSEQAEVLYKTAIRMAQLDGAQSVIDAYCGTGTIGLIAARNGAARVLGIELSPDAVEDAKANASANGIENARFVCADASLYLKSMVRDLNMLKSNKNTGLELSEELFHPDVVFLDPPRSGSTEQFLSSLIRLSPDRIVYISCNVETLERDLRYIVANSDYAVDGIQGVDMFARTEHVETVVVLRDKNIDGHINVKLDVEKLGIQPSSAHMDK